MLIGYARPGHSPPSQDPLTWTVSGGTAMTDLRLDNGQPAEATRIKITTLPITLTADWQHPLRLNLLCLLGLAFTKAAGTPTAPFYCRVSVTGKAQGDTSYARDLGVTDAHAFRMDDHNYSLWATLNEPVPNGLVGVKITINNPNRPGPIAITTVNDLIDIGEIGLFRAATVKLKPGHSLRLIDPSERKRTLGAQVHTVPRRSYKAFRFELALETEANTLYGGLDGLTDLNLIQERLSGAARCAIALDPSTPNTLNNTALFGIATPGEITHVPNSRPAHRLYTMPWDVEEIPPASFR